MRNKKHHGFLTVEAALVLPIFLYSFLAIIYFLQVLELQEMLQNAITETGLYASKYAYIYDYISEINKESEEDSSYSKEENIYNDDSRMQQTDRMKESMDSIIAQSINSTFYKLKMSEYLDVDKINKSVVMGGFDGIQTYLSSFMAEEPVIDIILVYDIKVPVLFFEIDDIPMVQRVRMRGWNGYKVELKGEGEDGGNDNEEMVYITETGTVYHTSKNCTHLTLSIQKRDISQIDILRNDAGGKYHACELCDNQEISKNQVFITNTGDRYHVSLTCSGLKRTILTVPLSEVAGRSICSRCKNTAD
ncbi:MAG: hypothetical protein K0R21_1578 [Anaerocolumna sp.]|jgi:hypothetical protein|nr:hypothetical protein [Anaerocolumna sp.]